MKSNVWVGACVSLVIVTVWWGSQVLIHAGIVSSPAAWAGVLAITFGMGLGAAGLRVTRDLKVGLLACAAMGLALAVAVR